MLTALSINTGGLGRFGNTLFTIAGTIGVAIKNNQKYVFPKWLNKDNALFGAEVDDLTKYFVNPLPELPEGQFFKDYPYHWEYKDIRVPHGNWNMFNHFQSFKYFEHCRETILHYFTMKDEPEQNDFVAIHYRAGDYTNGKEGYHPRMTTEYYREAIKWMPANSTYIVFTDDINVAKETIGLNCEYRSGLYLDDFRLMKRCRNFIIANSSFSAMAAWLGEHPEKKVISPSWDNWFGKASNINAKDLIHPDWIQIKTW